MNSSQDNLSKSGTSKETNSMNENILTADLQTDQDQLLKGTQTTLQTEGNLLTEGSSPITPQKSIIKGNKDTTDKKKAVGFSLQSTGKIPSDDLEEEKTGGITKPKRIKSGLEDQISPALNMKKRVSSTSTTGGQAVEHNLCVGKVQDGVAILLSEDFNIIEMPLSVLPSDVRKGNILKITIERNIGEEEARKENIKNIQRDIMNNDKLFDEFNKKLEYFKAKKMQLLQASQRAVPNLQRTVENVVGHHQEASYIDENMDNDRIIVRPTAVTDVRIEKPSATGGKSQKP